MIALRNHAPWSWLQDMGTHDFDIIIVMIIALVSDEHVSSAHEISIRKGELVDIDKHMLSI